MAVLVEPLLIELLGFVDLPLEFLHLARVGLDDGFLFLIVGVQLDEFTLDGSADLLLLGEKLLNLFIQGLNFFLLFLILLFRLFKLVFRIL